MLKKWDPKYIARTLPINLILHETVTRKLRHDTNNSNKITDPARVLPAVHKFRSLATSSHIRLRKSKTSPEVLHRSSNEFLETWSPLTTCTTRLSGTGCHLTNVQIICTWRQRTRLRNPKIHYRIFWSPSTEPVLSHLNEGLKNRLITTNFNVSLPFTPASPNWVLPFTFLESSARSPSTYFVPPSPSLHHSMPL